MKSFFLLVATVFAFHIAVAAPQPVPFLEARGDVVKPLRLNLAQLQKLAPVQTVKTTLKGQPYTGKGIRLWSIIEAAQPKLDATARHSEARFVVLARGRDGYAASFALPELMPEVGNKGAFLIWEANGKPLSAQQGPFRLVVPGEKKPMRWVYDVVAIEIYDGQRLSKKWRLRR